MNRPDLDFRAALEASEGLGPQPRPQGARGAGVTAVLGPTNTGKTHYAIERMLAHPSGIIGLPLRLLAREVYTRVVERAGVDQVALITGEEKIKPRAPRYWVATVEAMPRDLDVSFLAVDEIQLAANLDRGHVFTDRLLNRRGRDETLVIGATTMQNVVQQLLPGVHVVSRPRLSKLTFAGEKKLSRLPHRSAIVAFSAEEVYAIAELIRRQRGGAAVVLGALSPRTRNAQVAMYQNGDVDYLVATDAIGMGLNLDVDHVAFAGDRKFDGWQYRRLNPAEFGQIAGRAGRYLKDGTFGTTGRCPPLDEEEIEALEDHRFPSIGILQWRNSALDFGSIESLQASLDIAPDEVGLTRAPLAEDVMVLDIAARDPDVRRQAKTRADIARLWEVCQVPDYRRVSPSAHAELVLTLFGYVVRAGRIPDDWFARQLGMFERTDGDIDALSARIAQVRTLTFIANRPDWLRDPEHWQGVARQVEDKLSDALHERLAQRFVDRRTSVLMRRLRENAMLEAEVTTQGDVLVEGQHVGQLHGFRFTADPSAAGEAARALNTAALKALGGEIEARAERFAQAVDESIALANDGTIRWLGDPIAKLAGGDKVLAPRARVVADEHLTGTALETVQRRLDLWIAQHVKKLLGHVMDLETGEGLEGIARGIAFQVAEALGVLERSRVADEVKNLDQATRGILRKLGLRFGAYHIYLPALLKPAPRALASQLWALQHGGLEQVKGLDEVPYLAASGRTSFPADKDVPKGLYRAAGFRVCGERAVRVDILERLADLIRPAIAYRPGTTPGAPPPGAADGNGFVTTVAMTSLAGCSGEDFASILKSLGYVVDRRPGPAITVPLLAAAPMEPIKPPAAVAERSDDGLPVAAGIEQASGAVDDEPSAPPLEAGDETTAPTGHDAVEAFAPVVPTLDLEIAAGIEHLPAPEDGAAAQTRETAEHSAHSQADPAADHAPAGPSVDAPTPEALTAQVASELATVEGLGGEDHTAPEDHSALPEHATPAGDPERGAAELAKVQGLGETSDVASAPGEIGELPAPDGEALASADGPPAPDNGQQIATDAPEATAIGAPLAEPATPGEPTAPAEPVLIEVWRPHRSSQHHVERRNERGQGRRGQEGERRPQRFSGPPRERAAQQPAGGDAASAVAEAPGRQHHEGGRGERRPGFQPNRGDSGGRPRHAAPNHAPGGAPNHERGDSQNRPPRDRNRDRDRNDNTRRNGNFSSAERPPRERQPDPDSPFAKLLALKAELEGRTRKDS